MHSLEHVLRSQSLGSRRSLTSLHFGTAGGRPKVYIQAGLHAEELPGILTAHHLRRLLEQAETLGQIKGEVVLVPMANPIGLAQRVDHKPMGRFDLNTSENFNRHYPDLCAAIWPQVQDKLGPDAPSNVQSIRQAIAAHLESWHPTTELASQRKYLVELAYDADVALDLHCDKEALLYLYAETPCWSALEPLARLLGAQSVLLAKGSGGSSFDECLSGVWWQLAEKCAQEHPNKAIPIPQACASTTVELRGERDVSHVLARADADAILEYLRCMGVVGGIAPNLPALACATTPLAGVQFIKSPVTGVLVFAAQPGDRLVVGDLVAEVVDPINNTVHALRAEVDGVMYQRTFERYATPDAELASIAGQVAFRIGNLLGA